jgi:hypothetical protein
VDTGVVPVRFTSRDVGFELGPALLLPDGRVFQIGAEGHTALYNPSTNTWTAGPTVPGGQGADDTPRPRCCPTGTCCSPSTRPSSTR